MSDEANKLRKAIWDMMNFANMYVLVLDEKMNIKFANYSLANILGFENEHIILGRCWLDFIKKEDKKSIHGVHLAISTDEEENRFGEVTNDIVSINGEYISVKWFNSHINHDYNWSFSIGIQQEKPIMITEESIRAYYTHVIANDRTMILSLRNSILSEGKMPTDCEPDLV